MDVSVAFRLTVVQRTAEACRAHRGREEQGEVVTVVTGLFREEIFDLAG
jgi:hypothetical protein